MTALAFGRFSGAAQVPILVRVQSARAILLMHGVIARAAVLYYWSPTETEALGHNALRLGLVSRC